MSVFQRAVFLAQAIAYANGGQVQHDDDEHQQEGCRIYQRPRRFDVRALEADIVNVKTQVHEAPLSVHVREHAVDRTYFKSRRIADDLGMSAKEVGANIRSIRAGDPDLTVEKWGYSSGTTWRVTL